MGGDLLEFGLLYGGRLLGASKSNTRADVKHALRTERSDPHPQRGMGAELAKQIDSGMVHVNDATFNDEPLVAFGGEKASGFGRLNGQWALDEFTTWKWISVQHSARHYPFEGPSSS
jgi:Aldehyde dehydrogenase family